MAVSGATEDALSAGAAAAISPSTNTTRKASPAPRQENLTRAAVSAWAELERWNKIVART
jgi:hypothetical protein